MEVKGYIQVHASLTSDTYMCNIQACAHAYIHLKIDVSIGIGGEANFYLGRGGGGHSDARIHICTHIHTACTHTYMHTYIHACMHTYMSVNAYVPVNA